MQNEHDGEAPGSCYFTEGAGQPPVKVLIHWRGWRDGHRSLESHPRPFRRYVLFRSSHCQAKLPQSIWLKGGKKKKNQTKHNTGKEKPKTVTLLLLENILNLQSSCVKHFTGSQLAAQISSNCIFFSQGITGNLILQGNLACLSQIYKTQPLWQVSASTWFWLLSRKKEVFPQLSAVEVIYRWRFPTRTVFSYYA